MRKSDLGVLALGLGIAGAGAVLYIASKKTTAVSGVVSDVVSSTGTAYTVQPANDVVATDSGVNETPNIASNTALGLYSYQFPDGHIVGTNTPPSVYLVMYPTAKLVGSP